jgi:hypothetical protein
MSWQLLLTIIGASTGFVAGIWFCIDAISMTRSRIAKVCDNSWAADPGTAEALAAQSGEYLAGGVLLIMTFVLQMAAMHASPIPDQTLCSCLACLFALGFFFVLISAAISYPIFWLRKQYLLSWPQLTKLT